MALRTNYLNANPIGYIDLMGYRPHHWLWEPIAYLDLIAYRNHSVICRVIFFSLFVLMVYMVTHCTVARVLSNGKQLDLHWRKCTFWCWPDGVLESSVALFLVTCYQSWPTAHGCRRGALLAAKRTQQLASWGTGHLRTTLSVCVCWSHWFVRHFSVLFF